MRPVVRLLALIASAVSIASVLIVGVAAVPAQAACPRSQIIGGPNYFCLYEHNGYVYSGRHFSWNEDDWTYADTSWSIDYWSVYDINDQISSIWAGFAGCTSYFYKHAGYNTHMLTVPAGAAYSSIGSANDQLSSHIMAC